MKSIPITQKLLLAAAALGTFSALSHAQVKDPERIAEQSLAQYPVIDGHNDAPEQIRERFGNDFAKFDFRDTTKLPNEAGNPMHTDLARLKKGHVGGQFWSVWVDPELPKYEAVHQVVEQIDTVHRLIAAYPDSLALALTAGDVEAAMKQGKVASMIGMEGGHSIGNSLAVLRQMHALGARYMTLTHWKTLDWADSATDAPKSDGLSAFGVEVVREMNRLGMLVDISHVSDETANDALDVTTAPVIFSHSSAFDVTAHPRNASDDLLRRLKTNGGVIMVTFVPGYLNAKRRDWEAAEKAEETRAEALYPGDKTTQENWVTEWRIANAMPPVTASEIADHIDHIRGIAGIDHIAIGGDYDGIRFTPDDVSDVSDYPVLFTELAKRGYTAQDLRKISQANILRVMREAEKQSIKLAGQPK